LGQGFYQIDKREMAQAVAACLFDPVTVRKGRENLFEDPYYKSIFGSKNISFYLSKWRLMREVQWAARGYPERAYAKWLVLNFIWSQIGSEINSGYSERKFRYACEHKTYEVLSPLNRVLIYTFRAALNFYRLKRGEGEKAKDPSTFFQRNKLHVDFEIYWRSSRNIYRSKVKVYLKKFRDALAKIEIEE
jgi:hypothetical protein